MTRSESEELEEKLAPVVDALLFAAFGAQKRLMDSIGREQFAAMLEMARSDIEAEDWPK